MLSLHQCLFTLLFVSTLTGIKCQELTPVNTEESSLEDSNVTLSYRYSKQATGQDYFFWYRQYPGKPPEFLLSHFGTGTEISNPSQLSFEVSEDEKQMNLEIISAKVTDSAVYYCAVSSTDGGFGKLQFGSGIKLIVHDKEEQEPSFYKLGEGDTKVCLATGFSRYKELENDTFFNKIEPVRISKGEEEEEDSVFTQVAYMTEDDSKCNEEKTTAPCVETLDPDPMVNLMSLTTIGLRILFIKTIIFNVLMTLRLWISQ